MSDVIIGYLIMFFMGFLIALTVMLLSDNNNAIENDVFAQAMDIRSLQRKQSELRCELEMLKKQWEE